MAVQWDLKLWRAVTQNNAVLLRGLLQKPEVKKVIAGKSEWVFMRDPIHAAAFQGKIHMLEEFKKAGANMASVAISPTQPQGTRSVVQSAIHGQCGDVVDKLLSWGVQPAAPGVVGDQSEENQCRELTIDEELSAAKKVQGQIRSFEIAIWFHGECKMWDSKVTEMKAKIDELRHSPEFRTKLEIQQLEKMAEKVMTDRHENSSQIAVVI